MAGRLPQSDQQVDVDSATFQPVIDEAALTAFDIIPTPVAIFDLSSLRFLAVNEAAAQGLDRPIDDLLQTSFSDLHLPEDVKAFLDAVGVISVPVCDAGRWRLRAGHGGLVEVSICWRRVTFRGQDAALATWRDVVSLQVTEVEGATVSQERDVAPEQAEAKARLYRAIFESAPSKLLVLTPDTHRIVAANDAFLAATNCQINEIRGRPFFEVFPDDPAEPGADGVSNLIASLQRVAQTKSPDVMAVQRYPILRSAEEGGGFELRFWSQVNAPVLDPDGGLAYIIHRTEDVTELARGGEDALLAPLEGRQREVARELVLRSQELGQANRILQEQAAQIRTAERLLDLGTWTYNLQSQTMEWSDRIFALYGVPSDQPAPNFDGYTALLHPDDRDAMVAGYRDFIDSGLPHWVFQHRILCPDGVTRHLKTVGERTLIGGQEQIFGFVQDVTAYVVAQVGQADADRLTKMAGYRARLGGWRVDLGPDRVHWTEEVAAIHAEPPGTQPSFDQSMAYYVPASRELLVARFAACVHAGVEFDEVLQLDTAQANRIWVRSIGEPVRDPQGAIVAVQGALQDITELVEAQEKSVALSLQLRETLENMSDAFFLLDRDWRFSFLNRQAGILLGRRPEDLVGQRMWKEFPEGIETTARTAYERVMNERIATTFEQFFPQLDKWLRVSAHPAPEGLAAYFSDVTAERASAQHLRLLETAVAHLNDIVLITEASSLDEPKGPRVVYVNEAIERLTGYSRAEILGATPRMLQGPLTDRAELDRIRKAIVQAQPIHSEIVNYTKSGAPYWLDLDIVPLADAEGTLTHFVAIQRDITERKRAEESIRIGDKRFQLLCRATNDVIWDWDIKQDTVWWNEALLTLFGYDPAAIDTNCISKTDRIHPDDRERILRSIHDAIDGTGTNWASEYQFMRQDDMPRQVVDRGFVLRDEDGKAVRMIGSMIDVTERRELEQRYLQAQKLEAVGQLTGGVAHDFNNLLTIIMGNTEMLQDSLKEDDPLRQFADMSAKAADRAAELTRRLLAFSRKQALQPQVTDVNAVIAGIEGMLRRTLGEDIDIEIVRAGALWRTELDVGQLESALLNLANNSRDAMPKGGSLTIETANTSLDDAYVLTEPGLKSGQYVVIAVSDTGLGIPKDQIDRVFEPFFTTKAVGKGSGLGLSMVYGFVKQSDGHVRIYSEANEGTTVKLYFPRFYGAQVATRTESENRIVFRGQETILVVEDHDLILQQLVAQLSGFGYNVMVIPPESMGLHK